MSYLKIIGIIIVLIFIGLMLFSKQSKNRLYLKYSFFCLPFFAINITPYTDAFSLITYLFIFFFYKKDKSHLYNHQILKFTVAALLILIITGLMTSALGPGEESIKQLIALFPVFIFSFVLIGECLKHRDFFYEIIAALKFIIIFSFVFLFLQMIIGVQFSLAGSIRPNVIINGAFRYTSFLSDPQHYSQYLAVSAPILLIHKDLPSVKQKWIDVILISLCIVGIMSSGGRGGLMGLVLGLGIIIIFSNPKIKLMAITGAIIFYFVAINFLTNFSIFKRSTDVNDTYEFRYSIWTEAYQMFTSNPVFGIGLGNYSRHVQLHNPNQFWMDNNEWQPFDVPESGFLKILSETGASGFLFIFSLILIPTFLCLFKFFRTKDFNFLYLFAAIAGWLVSFNGTYTFFDSRMKMIIVCIITLMLVYMHYYKNEDDENEDSDELHETDTHLNELPEHPATAYHSY